jgi:hypothetical protein
MLALCLSILAVAGFAVFAVRAILRGDRVTAVLGAVAVCLAAGAGHGIRDISARGERAFWMHSVGNTLVLVKESIGTKHQADLTRAAIEEVMAQNTRIRFEELDTLLSNLVRIASITNRTESSALPAE